MSPSRRVAIEQLRVGAAAERDQKITMTFFIFEDGELMAAGVSTTPTVQLGTPNRNETLEPWRQVWTTLI